MTLKPYTQPYIGDSKRDRLRTENTGGSTMATTRTDGWQDRTAEARTRDYQLHLEGYCDNPACTVRTVAFSVKDYDHEVVPRVARDGVRCPLCRAVLLVSAVRTTAEY